MSSLDIDEILASVRAQTSAVENHTDKEIGRRQDLLSSIPLLTKPDYGEKLPLDRPYYYIEDFTALDEEDFLRNAYRVVLGREVDGVGRDTYLSGLKQGKISVVRVLSALNRSTEGKAYGAKIRRLTPAALLDRVANLPIIGRIAQPFERFLVRSTTNIRLSGITERHNDLILEMNSALSSIRKNQATLEQNQTIFGRNHANLEQEVEETRQSIEGAVDAANSALTELRATRHKIAHESMALEQLLEAARTKLPIEDQTKLEELDDPALDTFYLAFENRFRGSNKEITARAERYLPIFRATPPVAAGGTVLDIGCGRGEFLSLLKRNNIATRGIDLNSAMVKKAQSFDLDVIEGDAIDYLRAQPKNSLAAITGFHIVEHIDFKDLIKLFDAANHALMPEGIILFETPNPESLVVGACTFHYDPTHKKPLPPDYLRFVAESQGFENTRVIRNEMDCDLSHPESGFIPEGINDWFRQPPDYAVYASKPIESKEV